MDSAALAGNLTSTVWNDRILGESRMVSLPNRAAWVVTGNNLRVSSENVQRMVWIDLDPGDRDVARKRGKAAFRHPDLHGWAMEHRRDLVSAALTLVKFWLDGIRPDLTAPQNGHPDSPLIYYQRLDDGPIATKQTMGSFERWASVIGGILAANEVEGFLENRDRLELEADDELHDKAAFLRAWHEKRPDWITHAELVRLCERFGELHDHLPTDLMGARHLGRELQVWLREHRGARIDGLQLVKAEGRKSRWSVRATR